MTMKVPNTEIGSARPVITVLRQECRNRKTMAMVSSPPSIRVCWTLLTEFWMSRESSRMTSSLTPGGSVFCSSATALRTPRATSMVLAPCDFMTDGSARSPLSRAILALLLAIDDGGDLAQTDRRQAAAGDDQIGKARGVGDAAGDLDQAVVVAARTLPAGKFWFSLRTAFMMW